ncbi:type II toxin-antitoxin system VapC family toxin [Pyrodictium abyssi]
MACTVLDTDLLIALLRGRKTAVDYVARLEEEGLELATTVVNLFELYYGAYRSGSEKRVRAIRELEEILHVIGLDPRTAEAAAREAARLASQGMSLGFRDVLIGVAAREKGCRLATCNVKHLGRIEALAVEKWC